MLRIGVLVSGGGTNLQALIDRIGDGYLDKVKIAAVISSNEKAYAVQRAKDNGIEAYILKRSSYDEQDSYDEAMIRILEEKGTGLVVLAGFMVLLGNRFVERFKNRIINIHPSLIPAFCGKGFYGIRPHRAALEYGVKVSGATVHFVDADTDTGPIILQKAISIEGINDEMELQKKIMRECEWEILPKAVKLISEDMLSVCGRKVYIKNERGIK